MIFKVVFVVATFIMCAAAHRNKRIVFPTVSANFVFVFDSNSYVNHYEWECALDDAQNLVKDLHLKNPITPTGTRFGIITYDKYAYVDLQLTAGNSLPAVDHALEILKPRGGTNYRKEGLQKAYSILKANSKPGAYKAIILYVHDPAQYGSTLAIGQKILADNIVILVVAYGRNYDRVEALNLVKNDTNLFSVLDCASPRTRATTPRITTARVTTASPRTRATTPRITTARVTTASPRTRATTPRITTARVTTARTTPRDTRTRRPIYYSE